MFPDFSPRFFRTPNRRQWFLSVALHVHVHISHGVQLKVIGPLTISCYHGFVTAIFAETFVIHDISISPEDCGFIPGLFSAQEVCF